MLISRDDLEEFHRFATAKFSGSDHALAVEDLLAEWLRSRERDELIESVRQSIRDLDAGQGRPWDEFFEEIVGLRGDA